MAVVLEEDDDSVTVETALEQPNRQLLLQPGQVLENRWKIHGGLLYAGTFGQTFIGHEINTEQTVAIKAESRSTIQPLLRIETELLTDVRLLYPNIPITHLSRLYGSGQTVTTRYMVTELYGINLQDWRRQQPLQHFSVKTSLEVGQQMIIALQHLHDTHWLHRDVKPSNICLSRPFDHNYYLIDYGLARKFAHSNGTIIQPRLQAGFNGTARYASLTTHKRQELGRKDDLWSLFYVIVELITGHLPWRSFADKERIRRIKERTDFTKILENFTGTSPVLHLENQLRRLTYYGRPNYKSLIERIEHELQENE